MEYSNDWYVTSTRRFSFAGNLTYWGEFFAIIGVGTPAQYVPVQVDTGLWPNSLL